MYFRTHLITGAGWGDHGEKGRKLKNRQKGKKEMRLRATNKRDVIRGKKLKITNCWKSKNHRLNIQPPPLFPGFQLKMLESWSEHFLVEPFSCCKADFKSKSQEPLFPVIWLPP